MGMLSCPAPLKLEDPKALHVLYSEQFMITPILQVYKNPNTTKT